MAEEDFSPGFGPETEYKPDNVFALEAILMENVAAAGFKGAAFQVGVEADWENKGPGGEVPVVVTGRQGDVVAFREEVERIQAFIKDRLDTLSGSAGR